MSNRFLNKIASTTPQSSHVAKAGFVASLAGLGIGAANYVNNKESSVLEHQRIRLEKERNKLQEEQRRLDERSLRALNSIHKVLNTEKVDGK